MTLTTLDPTAALIVIDLQKGIVGLPLAHPAGGIAAPLGAGGLGGEPAWAKRRTASAFTSIR
jgi:hypothetical protein